MSDQGGFRLAGSPGHRLLRLRRQAKSGALESQGETAPGVGAQDTVDRSGVGTELLRVNLHVVTGVRAGCAVYRARIANVGASGLNTLDRVDTPDSVDRSG